jgi:hypothetical protein
MRSLNGSMKETAINNDQSTINNQQFPAAAEGQEDRGQLRSLMIGD